MGDNGVINWKMIKSQKSQIGQRIDLSTNSLGSDFITSPSRTLVYSGKYFS